MDTWYDDNNGGYKCNFDYTKCSLKTCADYATKCGNTMSNGCGGTINCANNCQTLGQLCNANKQCVECLSNVDCIGGKICSNEVCVSPADPCASKDCDDNNSCTDDSCSNGNCANTVITCPSGQTCDNGECISVAGNVTWQNMNSEPIFNADFGDSVKLVLNRSDVLDKNISYTIYKKDGNTFLFFFHWDKQIAQFSSIGFATWKTNETGEFYFNASVEGSPEIYSSISLDVGSEDNAKPNIEIVKPIENSTFILKSDGYTHYMPFEQNAFDEDDLVDVYWNFNDGNTTIFTNCNNDLSNCNTFHRYNSSFAGTRIINATVKESTRGQYEYDLSRIYIYKEGLVLFMIVDEPDYKTRTFSPTPIIIDASSTHVANCSSSMDACSAGGHTCYTVTDSVDSSNKLYCYKFAESSSNKFKFRWIIDRETKPEYPTDSSPFQIIFPKGGKHDIRLMVSFNKST
jgi:hypothetical protein